MHSSSCIYVINANRSIFDAKVRQVIHAHNRHVHIASAVEISKGIRFVPNNLHAFGCKFCECFLPEFEYTDIYFEVTLSVFESVITQRNRFLINPLMLVLYGIIFKHTAN